MPTTYYYGPQAWTGGTFNYTSVTTSDGNYPNATYFEDVKTVNAAGPAGERIIDSDDYGTSALDEQVTYFDARGLNDGNGLYYEIDVKFDSDVEAAIGDFAYPLNVGVGSVISARRFMQFRVALTEGKVYIWVRGDGEAATSATISADDQWHNLKAQIVPSSDNGDTMQDGTVRVWVDDVLVYEITDSWAWVPEATNPLFHLDYIYYGHYGILPSTNAAIYSVSAPKQAYIFGRGAAADDKATVTSDLTFLMNLDGQGRTVDEPNTLVVAGKLVVTDTVTLGATSMGLDALSDVTLTSPASGDLLRYNGTSWVNVSDGAPKWAEVSLSSSDLLALRSTPKTLVSAPGAGKLLEFCGMVLFHDAGTAYVESSANLAVKYENGSGAKVSDDIEMTGFIDQASDVMTTGRPKADAIVAKTGCENKALVLHQLGAAEWTTGTGTLRAKVRYRTWSTGW